MMMMSYFVFAKRDGHFHRLDDMPFVLIEIIFNDHGFSVMVFVHVQVVCSFHLALVCCPSLKIVCFVECVRMILIDVCNGFPQLFQCGRLNQPNERGIS